MYMFLPPIASVCWVSMIPLRVLACVCVCVCDDPPQSAWVCVSFMCLLVFVTLLVGASLCVSRQLFVNVYVCVYVSVFLYETSLCAHVCWKVSIRRRFCVSMYVCVSVFAGVCE